MFVVTRARYVTYVTLTRHLKNIVRYSGDFVIKGFVSLNSAASLWLLTPKREITESSGC